MLLRWLTGQNQNTLSLCDTMAVFQKTLELTDSVMTHDGLKKETALILPNRDDAMSASPLNVTRIVKKKSVLKQKH